MTRPTRWHSGFARRPERVSDLCTLRRTRRTDLVGVRGIPSGTAAPFAQRAATPGPSRTGHQWRDGRDVFHVLDVDDYVAMRATLRDHPANVAWQAQVTPLQEVPDDYSGADSGLRFVWSFIDRMDQMDHARGEL